MGAWGLGPFDSDAALDYLDYLADTTAQRDDEGDIISSTVNGEQVLTLLRATLRGSADPSESADVYAAAGLVAAALHPELVDRDTNTGTRLFAGSDFNDDLGLDSHCGYVVLLTPQAAAGLRADALAGVGFLREDDEWLRVRPGSIELLDDLEQLLTTHAPLTT